MDRYQTFDKMGISGFVPMALRDSFFIEVNGINGLYSFVGKRNWTQFFSLEMSRVFPGERKANGPNAPHLDS